LNGIFGEDILELKQNYVSQETIHHDKAASIPTDHGVFKMIPIGDQGLPHPNILMLQGDPMQHDFPVRIHSECFTGDVFGSQRCDCREQLEQSLKFIGDAKAGAVIYLRQEGRGIGLVNKLLAYQLQEGGADTVEANISLGLPVDSRDFSLAAMVLLELGTPSIRLLTNSPDKMDGLKKYGLTISARIPLEPTLNPHNSHYIKTKTDRLGQFMALEDF
jgi:3,4-dihydroxy 2-butanone 4-phosphate synthase/GTP cyclohydrolase II